MALEEGVGLKQRYRIRVVTRQAGMPLLACLENAIGTMPPPYLCVQPSSATLFVSCTSLPSSLQWGHLAVLIHNITSPNVDVETEGAGRHSSVCTTHMHPQRLLVSVAGAVIRPTFINSIFKNASCAAGRVRAFQRLPRNRIVGTLQRPSSAEMRSGQTGFIKSTKCSSRQIGYPSSLSIEKTFNGLMLAILSPCSCPLFVSQCIPPFSLFLPVGFCCFRKGKKTPPIFQALFQNQLRARRSRSYPPGACTTGPSWEGKSDEGCNIVAAAAAGVVHP